MLQWMLLPGKANHAAMRSICCIGNDMEWNASVLLSRLDSGVLMTKNLTFGFPRAQLQESTLASPAREMQLLEKTDTARRTFLPLRALICLWIGAKIPAGLSIHIVIHENSATKKSCGEKNIGNSWGGAKDIVFMNSTEVGKKLGITICLDCTCVSKYFGMCNALVKFTMQRGFWGSVTLTQIQAIFFSTFSVLTHLHSSKGNKIKS